MESAPEESGLLAEEVDESSSKPGGYRPLVFLGASAVIALAVALLKPQRNPLAGSLAELQDKHWFGPVYAASLTCYSFTGGTCSVNNCDAARGAICRSGECICEAGCAGPDGKCHIGESNVLVAADFTLTNVNWPKYNMYFQGLSVFGQMKTTRAWSVLNLQKDKFSLVKMAGPANGTRFMLGSVAFPMQVARIASTAGTAISGHGLYATDLLKGKGPDQLALSVCWHNAKGALMFGDKQGTYWAYIKRGTWLVYGSSSQRCDVGDSGLWTPSPAFSGEQIAMLPACC